MHARTLIDLAQSSLHPPDCRGNEIRIFRIDGNQTENNNEGRVDVCTGGQWGLLCFSNAWDVNFATVLCRQLGVNPSTGIMSRFFILAIASMKKSTKILCELADTSC